MNILNFKTLPVCILLTVFFFTAQSQGIITGENFETYTPGARLCTQAPVYWFTWNNAPGTAEDPMVVDSLAFQGSKSMLITGTNDVLLDLNRKTSGRYEVSFFTRIPSGKAGFYGLLHMFAGNNSEWGMQCFFDATNSGTIEAGGNSTDFSFTHDQWIQFRNVVDLDNDHAEFYLNQNLVFEWQWSKTLNGDPGQSSLDALNFFARNAGQRQPVMYVDSILYKEMPAPDPPQNLGASVTGNNITLTWEPPATGMPSGYKIYRDTVIIAPLVTGLMYKDSAVYPGEYGYSVKAVYGTGMSKPAGPVTATVEGGTPRTLVLLEIATGTWCTYCPGAALGADELVSNGKQVAVIEYHNNDDYTNADANARNTYYNIPGFPTAHFDGINVYAEGNMTQSIYPQYLPFYNRCMSKRSLFTLSMDVVKTSDRDLQVTLTARKIYPYKENNLRLHLVLTETHIPEIWQTFMTEVNFVCRKMYPDHLGTAADFSIDSIVTVVYTVSVDTAYKFNNCSLVAFLQDNITKEVLQTEKADLGTLGIEDHHGITVSVWPNPASGQLFVKSDAAVKSLTVLDICGRPLMKRQTGNNMDCLNVSSLKPGCYILSLETARGLTVKNFMIVP